MDTEWSITGQQTIGMKSECERIKMDIRKRNFYRRTEKQCDRMTKEAVSSPPLEVFNA